MPIFVKAHLGHHRHAAAFLGCQHGIGHGVRRHLGEQDPVAMMARGEEQPRQRRLTHEGSVLAEERSEAAPRSGERRAF